MHLLTPRFNFSKVSRILLSLLTVLILQTGFAFAQDAPFITVWKTDNEGSSEDNQITIPGTGTDYLIEWEEVDNEAANNGSETGTDEHTITFPSAGTYRVKISGDFMRIAFSNEGDREKILDIEHWGDIVWSSFAKAFYGCSNLKQTATDVPDLSNVTDMSEMFKRANSFRGDISNWDVSNVTNMSGMFQNAKLFNGAINNWDVSDVTDMNQMFWFALNFNQNLNGWDVSNVNNMYGMFYSAASFNADISNWDVSNVTDMSLMFSWGVSFNGDISNWEVSNVNNMTAMFQWAESFNGDLSKWDVSNVTDMHLMFDFAETFNGDISNWNVSNVNNMTAMFRRAWSFTGDISTWDVSNVNNMTKMFQQAQLFTGDLSKWDVSNVNNMDRMFQGAVYFNGAINTWDVSNVTDMRLMFHMAYSFNGDISNWDVSNVSKMNEMFKSAESFNQDLSNWNVSNVTDMSEMFNNSGLNTKNYDQLLLKWSTLDNLPTDISFGAENLKYCYGQEARDRLISEKGWSITGDSLDCESALFVTIWQTDHEGSSEDNQITIPGEGTDYTIYWEELDNIENNGVETGKDFQTLTFPNAGTYRISILGDFTRINFTNDNDQLKILDVEQWGHLQWSSMSGAFSGAKNLTVSAIDAPDLSLVKNMSYMFHEAESFNADLSNWEVSNVTDMSGMFYEATAFDQNLGSWNLSNCGSMFEFLSYSGLSLSNYDLSLEGWATNGNIPSDIVLSAEGLNYCASAEYRQQLINDFGWNIMGDETCSLAIEETMPAVEATSVEKDTEIYLTFDQEIEEIDVSGITLKEISGREISLTDIYIDSLKLYLVHNGLGSNTYEIMVPDSSFISASGKTNDTISWSFTTQRILSSKEQQKEIGHSTYPNPFSDFTTIQFNLPQTQSVNLLVFDLKGQIVRQETYDNLPSDEQSIRFERKDLPAGLYHYQLQSASGIVGGKMLIE